MRSKLPSLNGLKVFEAVARHLSFTKAANELHVTQAAACLVRRLAEMVDVLEILLAALIPPLRLVVLAVLAVLAVPVAAGTL